MRLSSKKPEPPETPKKNRWGCFWTAFCVLLCAAGILLLIFRKEAVATTRTLLAVRAILKFTDEQAVSLLRDFPFDPSSPPTLDEDLFVRYCRARAALAAQLEPLLPKLLALRDLRVRSASELRQAFVQAGPAAAEIPAYVARIEPTLRENRLSVELFRWTAIQVWGQVALASGRGESQALEFLKTGRERTGRLLQQQLLEVDPQLFSETVLKELGVEFVLQDPLSAWVVIQDRWADWAAPPAAPLIDLAAIKGWGELKRVVAEKEK